MFRIKTFIKYMYYLAKRKERSLMLVDGDNISAKALKKLLSNNQIDNKHLKIEVFCNTYGVKGWVNVNFFSNVSYFIVDQTPQSADLKLKSRLINLLSIRDLENEFTHIYLASNDNTFKDDIENLSNVFDVSIISNSKGLRNIPNVTSMPMTKSNTKSMKDFMPQDKRQLIVKEMSLVKVGSILKLNDIEYKSKLTEFLIFNGYEIIDGKIAEVPVFS